MIIKGSSRGATKHDRARLALHLVKKDNSEVEVVEYVGLASTTLEDAFEEMAQTAAGSRASRLIYHASINIDKDEVRSVSREMWREAADGLLKKFGMEEHAHVVVRHVKNNREHIHLAICRVHPKTLKTASDSFAYRKHEEVSREMELRWNQREVVGVWTREPGTPRPVAKENHRDRQAANRTGIATADVAAALDAAWRGSRDGRSFRAAVKSFGWELATGRKSIILVDEAGTPHSLPRRLGIGAIDVRTKLKDLDTTSLPSVEEVQAKIKGGQKMEAPKKKKTAPPAVAFFTKPGDTRKVYDAEIEQFWISQKATPILKDDVWHIFIHGAEFRYFGDRIECFNSDGSMPNEAQTDVMIAAIMARSGGPDAGGGIRFHGGTPEWQRYARTRAIAAGYPADKVLLECEGYKPQAAATADMPDHVKAALGYREPAPEPRRIPDELTPQECAELGIEPEDFAHGPRI